MERRDKINYYLDLNKAVTQHSTCMRRQFGEFIVQDEEVISTGYSGAPRGRENCTDLNYCVRTRLNVPRGERYELCRSVHAEMNAVISAARNQMLGSTMYLVGIECDPDKYLNETSSCALCKRVIINSGIDHVIIRDTHNDYRIVNVKKWIDDDETLTGSVGY